MSSDLGSLYTAEVGQYKLTHLLLLFDNLSVTLIFSASKFKTDINILKGPVTSLTIDRKHDTALS